MKRKKTNVNIFMVMFGFTFFSGNMLIGQKLVDGLRLYEFVLCIIIGGLVLGLFGGILAYISCKTNQSLDELTIKAFGEKGSHLPSILICITQIGWYGVGISMFAVPVSKIIAPNNEIILYCLIILFGGIMTFSTMKGVEAITRLSYIAVPVILIFGIGMIIVGVNTKGILITSEFASSNHIALILGIEMVIGSYISGSITTPNFTQYGKSPVVVAIISFLAFFVGNGIMFVFGAASKVLVGGSDIFDLFIFFNHKILGIVILGLNIWSSCDNGLYSAGLSLENLTNFNHRVLILISGVLGTLCSLILYNHFIGFLSVLNCTLPPVGTVLILDHFFKGKRYEKVNVINVIAVLGGGIIAIAMKSGISIINSMIVTTFIFLLGIVKDKKYNN